MLLVNPTTLISVCVDIINSAHVFLLYFGAVCWIWIFLCYSCFFLLLLRDLLTTSFAVVPVLLPPSSVMGGRCPIASRCFSPPAFFYDISWAISLPCQVHYPSFFLGSSSPPVSLQMFIMYITSDSGVSLLSCSLLLQFLVRIPSLCFCHIHIECESES